VDSIVMETEFATTSDRLLCRWLHYIGGFEALYNAPMCRPRLQGKFQANLFWPCT
jgi:hypothetical protein